MGTVVLGDLHLTRHSAPTLAEALARLLEHHRGDRVIVAGDFFDLATDAPKAERREAIAAVLDAHPIVRRALGEAVEHGTEVLLLSGNHDADLGRDDLGPAVADAVGLDPSVRHRIHSRPWFIRDGGLHVEHGHFYDPDNAPAHPLVVGEASLGVHFSSEFVHPTQAHRYLQANDGTPLNLFIAAFSWYGTRAPYVIYRYFHAAFAALAKAGPLYRAHHERSVGAERMARFAEDAGVPLSTVEAVFAGGVPSTLESWPKTFARLYLDRVLASLLLGSGASLALRGRPMVGTSLATLGGMLMTLSWLQGHNRYRGTVVEHLEHAARGILERTDAELVIFGHTHREALGDRYANTGTFAFPPAGGDGRPYLELTEAPFGLRIERRYA